MIQLAILIFSLVQQLLPGQPGIEFRHKSLYKEIEREWSLVEPEFTELDIPDTLMPAGVFQGRFFSITQKSVIDLTFFVYVGRVNSCRAGGCSISPDPGFSGESEYFDYFILFDPSAKVRLVRIFNYQATHGQEISAKGWLRQFVGYDGYSDFQIGKNIDAISGATASVYALTGDVKEKTRLLSLLRS